MSAPDSVPEEEFDPDALREKYRLERDKRLRGDGNAQYVELAGEFAAYLEDPYTVPVDRAPLTDDVPLGTGQVNWPAVLSTAAKVGVKHYFIEDESPTVLV